ncbi:outer membrane vitamin B12 receptor [Yokenella regensburgei ATCC 49455]|uniref:Vitamin B12 transporter BtuB n=2 Tax=Yokenella regensburgei TaxID=158877 RepID=A0AB38FWC0_9ENTR|nr:outer membrane vitamin B12 receptor [Yokenella regensburgei ATCC 49455]SQA63254.1 Outer membrane cobalamin translocator [Yokenella regensburgei]SQA68674.1 Outer membrane cobalamin translocator [Yokenella regensburgei]SUQ06989.1 Outer membrane cobalamin translocator [Yokenella regensburgei]
MPTAGIDQLHRFCWGVPLLFAFPVMAEQTMTVTANRFLQPVSTVLAPMNVVTKEDMDRWQSKSVSDVIRHLPGVDLSQNGGMGQNSALYIRGTEARHVLVLIDGIPVPRPGIANNPDFSQIPVAMVQRIEYIRGPRSAVHGSGAMGGVINIITQHDDDKTQVDTGIGSNGYQQYGATINKKIDKTVLTLAGNYERTKGYEVMPDSTYAGDHENKGHHDKFLFGSVSTEFNDNLNGFFRGYGHSGNTAYSQGDYGYDGGNNHLQNYTQSWDGALHYHSGIYASQLTASYQRIKDYNYNDAAGPYASPATLDDMEQYYLQWGHNVVVGHGMVSAGVDWKREKLTTTGETFDLNPVFSSQSYSRDNTGLYMVGVQQLQDVTLELSGREDHDEQFGWHGTWQTAAGWQFAENYQTTLSYGTAFLAPSLGQQYGATRFNIASNPNLKPEESRQWEIGLEGLTGPLDWKVSAYYNQITNLIDYQMGGGDMGMSGVYYNVNKATIKGIELTGQFATGPIAHNVTLQFIDPKNDETGQQLLRRAKQQVKYEISGEVASIGWNVVYNYVGKRKDTSNKDYTTIDVGGSSLWDVGLSWPVTRQLTLHGNVNNIFDKTWQTANGYNMPGREYTLSASYQF